LYLDGGLEAAEKFILLTYREQIEAITEQSSYKDPKTRLQEYLQARHLPLPEYTVIDVEGKTHDQLFKVSCKISLLNDETIGEGNNRRKAEQNAAEQILKQVEHVKQS